MAEAQPHRVVIVGGGFGGLYTAQNLSGVKGIEIDLIDRRNFHLFQPLLYQVATGGLSPANIAAPLRSVLRKQKNATVHLGEVTGFDLAGKAVLVGERRIPFDTLVVAAGSNHHYFGHQQWEQFAPGLKTLEDATEIRRRLLGAFERAENETDPVRQQELLTFVVVGGGPTGVEMAGSVSELARHTLKGDFRRINPSSARVVLVEGAPRVLTTFPEKLSNRAMDALRKMGVEVIADAHVTDIGAGYIKYKLDSGTAPEAQLATSTVIWAAGVRASPLGKMIADATGATTDRGGRVAVLEDMTIPNHPYVFVVGDMAAGKYPDGKSPLPGVAPVAMQQGKYVANVIWKRLAGRTIEPFRYWDKGSMATIGRASAVVDLYWLRFSGFLAWMTWLFIHLVYLVHFQNRFLVMLQWGWNYFTRNRSARLITKSFAEQVAKDEKREKKDGV